MGESVSLEELLQRQSVWVDWKEAGDRLAVVRMLVAFANDESDSGRGGHVLCGVEETKDAQGSVRPNVVGLSQGERTGLKQKVLITCTNIRRRGEQGLGAEGQFDAGNQARGVALFTIAQGRDEPFLDKPAYNRAVGAYASLDDIDMVVATEFRKCAKSPRPITDYFVPKEHIANT